MDRGMVSENNIEFMRRIGARIRGHLFLTEKNIIFYT